MTVNNLIEMVLIWHLPNLVFSFLILVSLGCFTCLSELCLDSCYLIVDSTMPSSFEGKYGSTRYWLRAELRRIRHRQETKTKRTIIFLNPLNVSLTEYQVTTYIAIVLKWWVTMTLISVLPFSNTLLVSGVTA